MGWKKLVIIGLPFLLVSCISFYHHTEGGFRPKRPNFTLAKEEFVYNDNIDTLAIYTKIDTLKTEDLKRVSYLKFYNNGRYFKNSFESDIGVNQTNLFPSLIGYYNTTNDSIKVEYYRINAQNIYDTQYIKLNGVIEGDSLIFENRFVKGAKDIYVKQKLNFIPKPSNW